MSLYARRSEGLDRSFWRNIFQKFLGADILRIVSATVYFEMYFEQLNPE